MKNRRELEECLSDVFSYIRKERRNVEMIKEELVKHNIPNGDSQRVISGIEPLNEVDPRELALYTMHAYKISQDERVNEVKYFEPNEVKEARTYERRDETYLQLPVTIPNVIEVEPNKHYQTFMSIKEIQKWVDGQLLNYNFDTQRQSKERQQGNEFFQVPTIVESSVREIERHLLDGTLTPTTLTFNVRPGSADEGDDLTYNLRSHSLTINRGVTLDVIDGYHRVVGSMRALAQKDIDFKFEISIRSYTQRTAQRHIGQVANTNPFDPSYQKSMEQARRSDWVVGELIGLSELRGKVSNTSRTGAGELVSFGVLSDAIDEVYSPSTTKEAVPVLGYLTEFFNNLLLTVDEFDNEGDSLIKENMMFVGYIILSKYMMDNKIPMYKLKNLISKIDFSRRHPLWREMGILDDRMVITTRAKLKVRELFIKLIKEGVFNV